MPPPWHADEDEELQGLLRASESPQVEERRTGPWPCRVLLPLALAPLFALAGALAVTTAGRLPLRAPTSVATGLAAVVGQPAIPLPTVGADDGSADGGFGTLCAHPSHWSRLGPPDGLHQHSDPGLVSEPLSDGAVRAAEILRAIWECKLPTGVRPAGAESQHDDLPPPPAALRRAMLRSPREVQLALEDRPVEDGEALPKATIDWASGGLFAYVPKPSVGDFLQRIFLHVAGSGLSIDLSPQDLFHGHMFFLPPNPLGGRGEFGIIFHAKEYPEDLRNPKSRHSGFNTTSPGYAERNLLYLASVNHVFVVDPVDPSGANHALLLNLDIADFLPDWAKPERARVVDETAFGDLGVMLPDVNYLPRNLSDPFSAKVLFTKGSAVRL